jgi:myo-inositol-1(or 4)-monophosphatase
MDQRTSADPEALLALAAECAREAGAMLRESFLRATHETSTKSTPTDLVSEADFAAERLIREKLGAARSDDAILGEEEGDSKGSSGLRWVVDPLDGHGQLPLRAFRSGRSRSRARTPPACSPA